MKRLKIFLVGSLALLLCACSSGGSSDLGSTGPVSPYAGKYLGKEVLEGGTFRIRIDIDDTGKVRVIDIDGRVAVGYLDGAKFVARRGGTARQVFNGDIEGSQITGTTTDNPFLGAGTFSAILQ